MEKGTVKWFDSDRNYGFIERENDVDVFVHGSEVQGDKALTKGDHVSFELKKDNGRPKAITVTIN